MVASSGTIFVYRYWNLGLTCEKGRAGLVWSVFHESAPELANIPSFTTSQVKGHVCPTDTNRTQTHELATAAAASDAEYGITHTPITHMNTTSTLLVARDTRQTHLLGQMALVCADVVLPNRHLSMLAHPNLISDLVNQSEIMTN